MGRHVKLSTEQVKRVVKRYQEGVSVRDIAKCFGVPESRIQDILYRQANAKSK